MCTSDMISLLSSPKWLKLSRFPDKNVWLLHLVPKKPFRNLMFGISALDLLIEMQHAARNIDLESRSFFIVIQCRFACVRYHQFKREWKHQKVPGESKHESARWNVRVSQSISFRLAKHCEWQQAYFRISSELAFLIRWAITES